ncbi:hypothetical protein CBS101457_006874 [Exobasidium rhododendri]|nr:hypothetical protein CBS101457_006874 [Exobasidium rhododendri]
MALMMPPGLEDHLLPLAAVDLMPTVVEDKTDPYDTQTTLVFYLTRHLTDAQDGQIRHQLEQPIEDFQKYVRYYKWEVNR